MVTIHLPRSETLSVKDDRQGRIDNASGTVLIVDDNPDVANASAGLLERLGYRVRITDNAEAALKEIESDSIDPWFSAIS